MDDQFTPCVIQGSWPLLHGTEMEDHTIQEWCNQHQCWPHELALSREIGSGGLNWSPFSLAPPLFFSGVMRLLLEGGSLGGWAAPSGGRQQGKVQASCPFEHRSQTGNIIMNDVFCINPCTSRSESFCFNFAYIFFYVKCE